MHTPEVRRRGETPSLPDRWTSSSYTSRGLPWVLRRAFRAHIQCGASDVTALFPRGCPEATREPARRGVRSGRARQSADRYSRRIVLKGGPNGPAIETIQVTGGSRSSFRPNADPAPDEVQSGRGRFWGIDLRRRGETLKASLFRHDRFLSDQLSPKPGMQVL